MMMMNTQGEHNIWYYFNTPASIGPGVEKIKNGMCEKRQGEDRDKVLLLLLLMLSKVCYNEWKDHTNPNIFYRDIYYPSTCDYLQWLHRLIRMQWFLRSQTQH